MKPAYNSVDMLEVELTEDDTVSREFNELLVKFREEVVAHTKHTDAHIYTKYHYDDIVSSKHANSKIHIT